MHECRALPPPGCLRIRLRIPPSLSLRNIGACRSSGPPNTCLVARIASVDALACTQPAQPVDLLAKPRATGRFQARDAVLTKRRRRCVHPAPIWQHSGPVMHFGTSSRRWGCAGRSYPSHWTSRSPPTWWERVARREQVAPIQPQAGIGRVLVWACFVRRKFSPHLAYSDRKRASGCSHATSKHRAASAGLLATAGEPASGMFIIKCIRDGRVPLAAAALRLERRLRWQVRAPSW